MDGRRLQRQDYVMERCLTRTTVAGTVLPLKEVGSVHPRSPPAEGCVQGGRAGLTC